MSSTGHMFAVQPSLLCSRQNLQSQSFFVVFMRTAFSAAASLADSRRLFHDCFDGVEEEVIR